MYKLKLDAAFVRKREQHGLRFSGFDAPIVGRGFTAFVVQALVQTLGPDNIGAFVPVFGPKIAL